MFAGETRTLTLYARDPQNNPQDLTDLTVEWRVGHLNDMPNKAPLLRKIATVANATAGIFTVALAPSDTMPFRGDYRYTALTTVDGAIQFVSDADEDIDFVNDDGDEIIFVSDDDGFVEVVTTGRLHVQRSVRQ